MKSNYDVSRPLRCEYIWLFILAFFSLHLLIAILLGNLFAFAPDERSYLLAFENLYSSSFRLEDYPGWPSTSELMVRIIHLPALFLKSIGISSLLSLRLLSILYVTLTATLITLNLRDRSRKELVSVIILLTTPSFFVFTGLGLRESFLYFALTGTFLALNSFLTRNKLDFKTILILCLFSYALLKTKPYIYFLFLAAVFVSLIIKSLIDRKIQTRTLLSIIVLMGTFALSPSTIESFTSQRHVLIGQINPTVTIDDDWRAPWVKPSANSADLQSIDPKNALGITQNELQKLDKRNSGLYSALDLLNLVEGSGTTENDDLWRANRTLIRATLDNPLSVLLSSFAFLFSPLAFLNYGSPVLELIAFEFPFWVFTYILLSRHFYRTIRLRQPTNFWNTFLINFSIGFIIMSALIEENLGTAIRHRGFLIILGLMTLLRFTRNSRR